VIKIPRTAWELSITTLHQHPFTAKTAALLVQKLVSTLLRPHLLAFQPKVPEYLTAFICGYAIYQLSKLFDQTKTSNGLICAINRTSPYCQNCLIVNNIIILLCEISALQIHLHDTQHISNPYFNGAETTNSTPTKILAS
jgi:hypothetical protein